MLTDLQVKKLTRYFQVYDIDDDGRIEESDFARIVENVGVLHGSDGSGPNPVRRAYLALWERLRERADSDRDQGIDLDEWLGYWQLTLEDDDLFESEVFAITNRLFSVFDLDEDNGIGQNEFADFYGIFGLSVDLATTVFETLDSDGDGMITHAELDVIARQFFRGDDVEEPGSFLFGPYGA